MYLYISIFNVMKTLCFPLRHFRSPLQINNEFLRCPKNGGGNENIKYLIPPCGNWTHDHYVYSGTHIINNNKNFQMTCKEAMSLWGYRNAHNATHMASNDFNPLDEYVLSSEWIVASVKYFVVLLWIASVGWNCLFLYGMFFFLIH